MTESRTATLFTDPPSAKPPLWITPFRAVWPLALAAVIAAFLFFGVLPHLNLYQQDILSNCGIYIILAVSLTVVNGFTGQFSIGHSGFMALGGYAAASLMYYGTFHWFNDLEFHGGLLSWMGKRADFHGHLLASGDWLFIGSLLFGGVVAAIIGWVVGLPSLRLRGDYLAIVTLGFCEIVRIIIQSTPDQLTIRPPKDPDADPTDIDLTQYIGDKHLYQELHHLGGALSFRDAPAYATVFWIALAALLTLALTFRLKYSSYGRAMLSIREDDIAAQAVGVNITKLKVRAFVFSAFFAGVAGGLFALKNGTINAGELGFQRSFDFVIMVVLGGMGSISGAAIAAVLLTLLPEGLREPPALMPWGWLVAAVIATLLTPGRRVRVGSVFLFCVLFGWVASAFFPSKYAHDWLFYDLILILVISLRYWLNGRPIAPAISVICACVCWEVMRSNAVHFGVNLSNYRLVIYSLLLIGTMIARPQGLFGVNEIWDYLPFKLQFWHRPSRGEEGT